MSRWLDITFPRGFKNLDRNFETKLAEHHYPGAPGDEHEDMGDGATVITVQADLMTTYNSNGTVKRTAESYFQDLLSARAQRKADTLFLDNGDPHLVWLRRITRRDESPDLLSVDLEFVETLDESLRLVTVPPKAEQKLDQIDTELTALIAESNWENLKAWKKKALGAFNKAKALYGQVQEFSETARDKIRTIKNSVVAIRNAGAGMGRELERLSADIAELVAEGTSLFNDLATNPLGTFAIGRSIMNMVSNLKGINYQFSPPPRSRGQIVSGLILQRVDTHVVAEGESLQDVARREYGSAALWTVIADANDVGDPMAVAPGDELIIPAIPPEQIHGTCKTRPQILKAEYDAQSNR